MTPSLIDVAGEMSLASWLAGGRRGVPTTTNQPASEMPFQRWFKVKEAFAPQFVEETLNRLPYEPESCYDPFGGSGTTALTCQFMGIKPTTSEVNPFMADLIESKLCAYDIGNLIRDYTAAICVARRNWRTIPDEDVFPFTPSTFIEPGISERWLFGRQLARALQSLINSINKTLDCDHRRLMRVILGGCLIRLSNVIINGKGRRYRGGWQERKVDAEEAFTTFECAMRRAASDIRLFSRRKALSYEVIRGDSRKLTRFVKKTDAILFSPPYPNSFDYTDIYNVELWMLGYLKCSQSNRTLRQSTLRSHVQVKHDRIVKQNNSQTLNEVYSELVSKRARLWNRNIPEMACHYFDDMNEILIGCRQIIKPEGYVMMAVGDSCYDGVMIDVPKILTELCEKIGFTCTKSEAVRSMRSSAQQGGEHDLSESLLWMQAV